VSNSNAERVDDTLDFMTTHGAGILAGQLRGVLTTEQVRDQAGAYIKVDAKIKTDTDRARQALLCAAMSLSNGGPWAGSRTGVPAASAPRPSSCPIGRGRRRPPS